LSLVDRRGNHPKRDQKERGRFLGGTPPWGYRKGKDGALEPVPEQQAAIARMRQLRAEGVSLRKIMGQMSAEGHPVTLPTLMRLTGGEVA
jgi:hypothetical protein